MEIYLFIIGSTILAVAAVYDIVVNIVYAKLQQRKLKKASPLLGVVYPKEKKK